MTKLVNNTMDALQQPPFHLAAKRLKDEHDALKDELAVIEENLQYIFTILGTDASTSKLQELRAKMVGLMKKVEAHERWEEQTWFPMLFEHADPDKRSSFHTTLWILGEDHKKVERFVHAFYEAAQLAEDMDPKHLNEAVASLTMTCSILHEHFMSEEDMVYALTNLSMEDLVDVKGVQA
ncbi:Hemerythrin HHE cation binding domain protein [compost metagenome]